MQFAPQDLNTRLCAARDCPDDAMLGWALCERHERARQAGRPVALHELPPPQEPVLRCSSCYVWKPDAAFPLSSKPIGGPVIDRRGRHNQCTQCNTTHKRINRNKLDAATQQQIREFENARQRARRAARKAQP